VWSAPDGTIPLPPKIVAAPPFGLYGRAAEQALWELGFYHSKNI
jgi:hypothetical protein